jgi:hypothetical protein
MTRGGVVLPPRSAGSERVLLNVLYADDLTDSFTYTVLWYVDEAASTATFDMARRKDNASDAPARKHVPQQHEFLMVPTASKYVDQQDAFSMCVSVFGAKMWLPLVQLLTGT